LTNFPVAKGGLGPRACSLLNRARWSFISHPILFTPIQVGNLKPVNCIVITPMQQYSAEDGQMNDWHLMHLGQLAIGCRGINN
jgi:hypothetical protein